MTENTDYTVSIDLLDDFRLNRFAEYNPDFGIFTVNGDFVEKNDVGTYVITVKVNFGGQT